MTAEFDARWDALSAEIDKKSGNGKEVVSALKELYSLWDERLYLWLASLYDPKIGGFYFSACARDNEPFLPDIESTSQAVTMLCELGMIESGRDLPEEMRAQMGQFLLNCFDAEDGYFYHPQWGKNIIAARRGRDLMWARGMMRTYLDVELPAPTAAERLKKSAETGDRSLRQNLPEYLGSADALVAYLKGWDWDRLAYPSGNNLAAQQDQIIAAGLTDAAVEFLNSIQNQETGMWGNTTGYDAVNGYLKISSFYIAAGKTLPNAQKAIDAVLACLTSDEPALTMCYQYNVWFTIRNILMGLRTLGEEGCRQADQLSRRVLLGAPAALRKTREKIAAFAIGDGSFLGGIPVSNGSSGQSQGAWVDIRGAVSGNINASIINSGEMLDKIYAALELSDFFVPVFGKADYAKFLAALPRA